MRPVTLTDGPLVLRPPVPGDAAAVLRACQDPDIVRWTRVPTPYTAADAEAWVGPESAAGWADETQLVWYACAADAPDVPLVSVGLHHLDLEARDGEIGYWAVPAARGRGLTTDAVRMACRFAFDRLGLDRVEWIAGVGNDASRRVAEKAGFTIEATARERLVLRGRRDDAWIGGLLPGDLDGAPPEVREHPVPASHPSAAPGARPMPPSAARAVRGVEITAGSLHLRPWREQDVADISAVLQDPRIARWNPFKRTGTVEEDAAAYLTRAMNEDAAHVSFAVVDATTGGLLGSVALHHLDGDTGNAELGYWTTPDARGRGVATGAAAAATRWGFGALGLGRIELFHAVENPTSCGVAERAGYAHEGTLRSSYRYGDGLRHDEHLHGRLAGDPEPS